MSDGSVDDSIQLRRGGRPTFAVKVMTTGVRMDVMWARLLRADGRAFAAALECKPWMLGGRIAATDGGLA